MNVSKDDIELVNKELALASVPDDEYFAFEDYQAPTGLWDLDIALMHRKFGVQKVVNDFDREKLLKFLKFRLDFLNEELTEAKKAYDVLVSLQDESDSEARTAKVKEAADEIVDAMIDLCVVAIGTLDAYQVDPAVSWDRVYAANIVKEPGVKPERPNPLGLPDLIKPEGWKAPEHFDNLGLLQKL